MHQGRFRTFRKSAAGCLAAAVAAALPRAAIASPVPASQSDALVDTIGVNIHTWDGGSPFDTNWQGVINRIGDMGIRQVRDHGIEPDKLNMLTDQLGTKIDSIIQYPIHHRSLEDLSYLDLMLNYARQIHGITWLEGPNEYGDVSVPETITTLKTWTEQLKARTQGDPVLGNVKILAPTPFNGYQQLGDLTPYVDYANIHPYTAGKQPSDTIDAWKNFVQPTTPNMPFIASEIGFHDEDAGFDLQRVSEPTAGKYVPRAFFEFFNRGVVKTFIYQLLDDHADPGETYGEHHFGMLNNDLSYKASGLNTKNLIALLADPGPAFTPSSLDYTLTGGDADVHSTLLQKRDGKFYLAIWQEKLGYDNQTRTDIVIPDQALTLTLTSPMMLRRFLLDDVSAPLQVSGSMQFQLNVPDQVLMLELSSPQAGWNVNAGGDWSASSNWAGASIPNGTAATANFLGAIQSDQTVTLDTGRSVGMVNFWNNNRYTIAGSNPLTMQTGSGNVQASINVLSGSHTIAAPLALASNTTIDVDLPGSTLNLTGDMTGTGALTKTGAGTLEVKHVRAGDLAVRQGNLKITPNSTATGTSHVGALSISPGATIDLTDNKLITNSPRGTWTGSTYDGVTGLVTSGRLTSTSTTGSYIALGVARASDTGITATTIWAGQTVAPSDTLVMYTYAGDATLDGQLNIDDYVKIDAGLAAGSTGWSNGDFNYDGKINIDDYVIIDSNISTQGTRFDTSAGATLRVASVPEPSAALTLAATAGLLIRRRKSKTTAA